MEIDKTSDFYQFMSTFRSSEEDYFFRKHFPDAFGLPFSVRDRIVLYAAFLSCVNKDCRSYPFIPTYKDVAKYATNLGLDRYFNEEQIVKSLQTALRKLVLINHIVRPIKWQLGILSQRLAQKYKYSEEFSISTPEDYQTLWCTAFPASFLFEVMRILQDDGVHAASTFVRTMDKFARLLAQHSREKFAESDPSYKKLMRDFNKVKSMLINSPRFDAPVENAVYYPWRDEIDLSRINLTKKSLTTVLNPNATLFRLVESMPVAHLVKRRIFDVFYDDLYSFREASEELMFTLFK